MGRWGGGGGRGKRGGVKGDVVGVGRGWKMDPRLVAERSVGGTTDPNSMAWRSIVLSGLLVFSSPPLFCGRGVHSKPPVCFNVVQI